MIGATADENEDLASTLLAQGRGSLEELPGLVDRLGVRKSLLVVGPGVTPAAERVRSLLGGRCAGAFSDAVAHVPSWEANLAVASAQEVHADSVIAIGGGSAAGYAKIVALALRLPRVAVPTTLSGAELTSRYLVTTEKGKESGNSERAAVRAVVRDPDLLTDVPVPVLASSGMGAVGACVDVLARPGEAGRADATEGLRLLWDALPRLVREPADPGLRERALAGAALAGAALEAAGPGPAQLVAEDLGATHRADHGALMACLVPHVVVEVELVRELAGPGSAADALRRFAVGLRLPVDLGAVCPPLVPDAVVARLAERRDLADRADPDSMLMLLKEALR
jgi:maleylacetate reductase